jgi:uncharacterized protein YbjT (DUF2867 family)
MFAITGITGQVGGSVARALLAAGKSVRAVVRDQKKGEAWAHQGCEIALADMNDTSALRKAFAGAEGVLILLPPNFDPAPGFPESRAILAALQSALSQTRPERIVSISTVGAQAAQENLLSQHTLNEKVLGELPIPITFLRPAWFMENAAWDLAPARDTGVIPSFLQPLDRRIPMVATADIGRVAAKLLQESWAGRRTIELEGPRAISPNDIAATFGSLLGRSVSTAIVPREKWEALFRAQGMKNPLPRMRMLDGFNEGWLSFEHQPLQGEIALDTVLRGLIERGS